MFWPRDSFFSFDFDLNFRQRKLEPKLTGQELQDVIGICCESVYPALQAIDGESDFGVSFKYSMP